MPGNTTRRPDLEAESFHHPKEIGSTLMPPLMVAKKEGNQYYRDVTADTTAQTGRTVGAAPTAQTINSASDTFSVAEAIDRVNAGESELALHGGLAAWQSLGARVTKRNVLGILETDVATLTIGNASITAVNILNDFIGTVENQVEAILDIVEGDVVLFGSKRVVNRSKKYAEVIARMTFTGVPAAILGDVRNISDGQLAATIGVDRILAGPLAEWFTASSDYQERLGLMVVPDGGLDPREEVQFGRVVMYQVTPGSTNIFEVLTHYDDNLIADVVTTRAWRDAEVYNVEAARILNGVDELNASSTTTTTSTTTA